MHNKGTSRSCTLKGTNGFSPYLLPLPLRSVEVCVTSQLCSCLSKWSHMFFSSAPLPGGSPGLGRGEVHSPVWVGQLQSPAAYCACSPDPCYCQPEPAQKRFGSRTENVRVPTGMDDWIGKLPCSGFLS